MKDTILDCAQELIQRLGANGMSYNDISKEINITKASIHHHFPSKEDLINSLLIRYRTEFKTSLDEILNSSVKPRNKLQKLMSIFENTLSKGNKDRTCLCGMLSAELFSLSDETANLVREFLNDTSDGIYKILKEGKEDNSFKIEGNLKITSDLILACLEGGLFMARAEGGPERFHKLLKQIEKTIT